MTNRSAQILDRLAGLAARTPRQDRLLNQLLSDQAASARSDELVRAWRAEDGE